MKERQSQFIVGGGVDIGNYDKQILRSEPIMSEELE